MAHEELLAANCVISTSPLAHAAISDTRRRDLLVTGWPGEFDGGMQPEEDLVRMVPTDQLASVITKRLATAPGTTVTLMTPSADGAIDAVQGLPWPTRRIEDDGVTVLVWSAP